MKIEWTTIESWKNKTNSKINRILENKNKISVFFAENKKHLFWAWISTMAMAFVVTAWNMSGTEFSADIMFPSLTQEIESSNWTEWNLKTEWDKISEFDSVDNDWSDLLWDLDLNFDDVSEEKTEVKEDAKNDTKDDLKNKQQEDTSENSDNTDDTEDLINDLFWLEDNAVKDNAIKDENLENNDLENNDKIESKNLSWFLNDNSEDNIQKEEKQEEGLHWSAKELQETDKIVEKKSNNSGIFKQNFNTVDMNLVAQKALLKDVPEQEVEEIEEFHWSMDWFFNQESAWISSWVKSDVINQNNLAIQKTKKLSQSWPEDMVYWLWFLSTLLAYFFRRKKRI